MFLVPRYELYLLVGLNLTIHVRWGFCDILYVRIVAKTCQYTCTYSYSYVDRGIAHVPPPRFDNTVCNMPWRGGLLRYV